MNLTQTKKGDYSMKTWHVSKAKYDKTVNMVSEHRVANFETYEAGIEYLNKYQDDPIYLWHDNAVELDNPYLAMVETDNYRKEYSKVTD